MEQILGKGKEIHQYGVGGTDRLTHLHNVCYTTNNGLHHHKFQQKKKATNSEVDIDTPSDPQWHMGVHFAPKAFYYSSTGGDLTKTIIL